MNQSEWIWQNGEWKPWAEANVHVTTHGLHYGSSVFEGIRAYETPAGPAVFRLPEHVRRLVSSARLMRMGEIGYDAGEIEEICIEIVRRNGHASCYIRPIAFRGPGSFALNGSACPIEMAVISIEWGRYLGAEAIEQGVDVIVSSWRRFAPGSLVPLGKIGGQYVANQLVSMEAKRFGAAEGLMLDAAGNVCEGAGENVFLVLAGEIYTPPLASSILAGITRESVLTLAADLGIPVRQEAISRDMLHVCDEVFMTGTAAEITPVRSVDDLPVGEGGRGPITHALQDEFFGIVSGEIADRHGWLSIVSR